MNEINDYNFWYNETHKHGKVYDYGPEYRFNKIIQQILFNLELPEGKVVMLGSHRCFGLNILCEKYGSKNVIGFDLYNPTNHPCVKVKNIIQLKEKIDCALTINDLSFEFTPRAKIAGQEWAAKNTVKNGYVLCTTNSNSANYKIEEYMREEGFELIKLNQFPTKGIEDWVLDVYCLYKKCLV